ncbi:hypothetical protein VTG60DRAFT_2348 [Thermothelomyces hinnuleus]
MASPVSFGDAVAMAKIARRIANAFTQGQESPPAEFREVESQLYALDASLSAFRDVCGTDLAALTIDPSKLPAQFRQGGEQDREWSVAGILDSCGELLKHLEKIVDRYSVIAAPSPKDPTRSRLQRWSAELVRNYKKIAWTTEAGDLATLRSQLMVYTNALELVLGVILNSRTTRIENAVEKNSTMLEELYRWARNFRDDTAAVTPPVERGPPDALQAPSPSGPASFFELHIASNGVSQLLCPRAWFYDNWKEARSNRQLFECRCSQTASNQKHPKVEGIASWRFSFPFRRPGDTASWTLFQALDRLTNRLVSVTISNVAPSDISKIEQSFIQPLAGDLAIVMLRQGISNQLAHLSPDGDKVRVLRLQSDLRGYHKLIESVTFRVGHRTLSKPYVEGLSLLNYRELSDHHTVPLTDTALDQAELSIYYGSETAEADEPADITKSIAHITHATPLVVEKRNACVVVPGVECLGYLQDQQVNRLANADITFHMISPQAARDLYGKLEEMRTELIVTKLQFPRTDETATLHIGAR